jgi:hypothetical protein
MNIFKLSKERMIALSVAMIAIALIFNWYFPTDFLNTLNNPDKVVNSKPVTLSSIFVGAMMLYVCRAAVKFHNKASFILISMSAFWLQALAFVSILTYPVHPEQLFFFGDNFNATFFTHGYPSFGAIAAAFLVSVIGIITLFNSENYWRRIKPILVLLVLTCVPSIFIDILNLPWPFKNAPPMCPVSCFLYLMLAWGFYVVAPSSCCKITPSSKRALL